MQIVDRLSIIKISSLGKIDWSIVCIAKFLCTREKFKGTKRGEKESLSSSFVE